MIHSCNFKSNLCDNVRMVFLKALNHKTNCTCGLLSCLVVLSSPGYPKSLMSWWLSFCPSCFLPRQKFPSPFSAGSWFFYGPLFLIITAQPNCVIVMTWKFFSLIQNKVIKKRRKHHLLNDWNVPLFSGFRYIFPTLSRICSDFIPKNIRQKGLVGALVATYCCF